MIFGIAVDWSALPYLLYPFPRSSPSGHPRSVVPQSASAPRSEKSCKQRFGVFPVKEAGRSRKRASSSPLPGLPVGEAGRSRKRAPFLFGQAFRSERRAGVESERRSSLARPSGWRLDRPSGLSFRYLGRPRSCASFATSYAGPSFCWEADPLETPGL